MSYKRELPQVQRLVRSLSFDSFSLEDSELLPGVRVNVDTLEVEQWIVSTNKLLE